ncbi:MAG: SOS response-associated peptidase [Rhodospirillales bacterium]|nr:SOS response-associated peptidase [Rhodospirillales bacterium]
MCSRYELIARPRDLAGRFRLSSVPPVEEKDEIRPTDTAPVITGDGRLALMAWGLPAFDGKPLINARAETLRDRPTFRHLLESRCLVPATAYFEWRRDGRYRLKNRIAAADGATFALAGLTDGTRFTIVTRAAAPAIAHIHDRMPVILSEKDETDWINRSMHFEDVASLLLPQAGRPLAFVEEEPRHYQPSLF